MGLLKETRMYDGARFNNSPNSIHILNKLLSKLQFDDEKYLNHPSIW